VVGKESVTVNVVKVALVRVRAPTLELVYFFSGLKTEEVVQP